MRPSGAPDQNFKPSTILWDNVNDTTFAQEGNKDLGTAYVQILDNTGTPINNFGTPASPLFAPIVASTSGVTNLVAATGGKSIRVLQIVLVSNGAVNVKFQSHVTPTDLTGLFYLVANTGFSSGYSPVGQFQTTIGEALDINLSGSVAIGGYLTYILI